jgi:hypothetical protein
MATARRHRIIEMLRKLFWPEWLAEPEKSTGPSQDTAAPPELPETAEKEVHETRPGDTGALQNVEARNAQANATQPQPPRWDTSPFSAVLGTNTHGQPVSLTEEVWRQFLVPF